MTFHGSAAPGQRARSIVRRSWRDVSRLLVLLPAVPAPLDAGAKIRNSGLLKLLGSDHEVDAIAFGSPTSEPALAQLTRRSRVIADPAPRGVVRRSLDLASSPLPDLAQ